MAGFSFWSSNVRPLIGSMDDKTRTFLVLPKNHGLGRFSLINNACTNTLWFDNVTMQLFSDYVDNRRQQKLKDFCLQEFTFLWFGLGRDDPAVQRKFSTLLVEDLIIPWRPPRHLLHPLWNPLSHLVERPHSCHLVIQKVLEEADARIKPGWRDRDMRLKMMSVIRQRSRLGKGPSAIHNLSKLFYWIKKFFAAYNQKKLKTQSKILSMCGKCYSLLN